MFYRMVTDIEDTGLKGKLLWAPVIQTELPPETDSLSWQWEGRWATVPGTHPAWPQVSMQVHKLGFKHLSPQEMKQVFYSLLTRKDDIFDNW